jgi:hypothetical protein
LDIAWAKSESLELLFHNGHLSLLLYPDLRNGKNAYKAKYQIEIEVNGTVEKDSKNVFVPARSYWEIYYKSKGKGNLAEIKIQRISSMKATNDIAGDLHGSGRKSYTLIIKK